MCWFMGKPVKNKNAIGSSSIKSNNEAIKPHYANVK